MLAEILDKPCSLHDGGFRRLADGQPVSREAPVPRLLDSHIRCRPQIERALATLSIGRPGLVPAVPDAGMHHRTLIDRFCCRAGYIRLPHCARVRIRICVNGSRRSPPRGDDHRAAAGRSCLSCGSAANQRAALVREMVSSSPPSESRVRRAGLDGLCATGRRVVALIEPASKGDERTPEELESVAHASGADEAWVAAMPDGMVVVLLELNATQPHHRAIQEAVRASRALLWLPDERVRVRRNLKALPWPG